MSYDGKINGMTNEIEQVHYQKILQKAEQTILAVEQQLVQSTNCATIEFHWIVGEFLARVTEEYQWSYPVLADLSRDLCKAFANEHSYSEQNLRHMRQFYYEYCNYPELLELAKNVLWNINMIIIHNVKSYEARMFYLQRAANDLCGQDGIELQIKSQAYEQEGANALQPQLMTRSDTPLNDSEKNFGGLCQK
ncbi:conserved protein of unknown function (plasmid) [Legionella fallonii LLAP-10]|uniref:YhcG N-terminal domain-containing protein n=2 Tax=Legionella fallonii TaxID=96230 RepID=A0A098GBD8_9GAMM|nr:conserved protein of unknown function [Legionella fallonii LLAP-10]